MKTKIIIIILLSVIVIGAGISMFLYFKDFIIPYGRLEQIMPINANEAIILYKIKMYDNILVRIGLVNKDRGLIWSNDLPGYSIKALEGNNNGISYKEDIVTVRYYQNQEQIQATIAYNISNGKELWRSQKFPCNNYNSNSAPASPHFSTYREGSDLFEYYLNEEENQILVALDKNTGKIIWQNIDTYYDGLNHFQLTNELIIFLGTIIKDFEEKTDWIYLKRSTGEQVYDHRPSSLGYDYIIDNEMWYCRGDGLHVLDLTTFEDTIKTSDYYKLYQINYFPSFDYCGLYKDELVIFAEKGLNKFIGISPQTGQLSWKINIGSTFLVKDDIKIKSSYPSNHYLSGHFTRFLPIVVFSDYYKNSNVFKIIIADLEKKKIIKESQEIEDTYIENIFKKDGYYYLSATDCNKIAVIEGNSGQVVNAVKNSLKLPQRLFPFNIKDGYLWLPLEEITTFPSKNWIVLDAKNLQFVASGDKQVTSNNFKSIIEEYRLSTLQ